MSQTQAIGGGVTSGTVEAPGLGQKRGKLESSSHVSSPSERLVARETPKAFSFLSMQKLSKRKPCRGSGERTWSGGLCAKISPKSSKPPAGRTQAPRSSRLRRGAPPLRAARRSHSRRCAHGSCPPRAIPLLLQHLHHASAASPVPAPRSSCHNLFASAGIIHRLATTQVTPSCNDTHF